MLSLNIRPRLGISIHHRSNLWRLMTDRHWLRPNELIQLSLFNFTISVYWPRRNSQKGAHHA